MFKFLKKSEEMKKEVVEQICSEEVKSSKELIRYVRNSKGHPVGMFIALGADQIGYSLCHKDDKWDKEIAKKIARNRALSSRGFSIPASMLEEFNRFVSRVQKVYGVSTLGIDLETMESEF